MKKTPHNVIIRISQTTHCSQSLSIEFFLADPNSQLPIASSHYFPSLSIVPKISESTLSMLSLISDSCIPLKNWLELLLKVNGSDYFQILTHLPCELVMHPSNAEGECFSFFLPFSIFNSKTKNKSWRPGMELVEVWAKNRRKRKQKKKKHLERRGK